jgi:hypothetical protein
MAVNPAPEYQTEYSRSYGNPWISPLVNKSKASTQSLHATLEQASSPIQLQSASTIAASTTVEPTTSVESVITPSHQDLPAHQGDEVVEKKKTKTHERDIINYGTVSHSLIQRETRILRITAIT